VLTRRRVLVVEDEALVAMEFELLLEQQGCIVIGPAATVAAALRLVGSEAIDAALLDVNLPDGRSTPVASALRELQVPFVVVSGYNLRQLDEPELLRGAAVQKPADHVQLIDTLLAVLRR